MRRTYLFSQESRHVGARSAAARSRRKHSSRASHPTPEPQTRAGLTQKSSGLPAVFSGSKARRGGESSRGRCLRIAKGGVCGASSPEATRGDRRENGQRHAGRARKRNGPRPLCCADQIAAGTSLEPIGAEKLVMRVRGLHSAMPARPRWSATTCFLRLTVWLSYQLRRSDLASRKASPSPV
jgi:hypothetical protein